MVLVAGWVLAGMLTLIALPPSGATYALYSRSPAPPQFAYVTMSGDTAFTIPTPLPVNLGTYAPGANISATVVLQIYNNTGVYGTRQQRGFTDLSVQLIQDSGPQLSVTTSVPATLPVGSTANVSISGKAGKTLGTVHGYFHITALNGFLTLDVPAVGTIAKKTGVLALVAPSAECETDALPDGSEADAVVCEPPAVTPTDPVVAPTDPAVVPTDPVVAPTDPVVAPTDPVVAPTDPAVAPTDPAVAPADPPAAETDPPAAEPDPPTAQTDAPAPSSDLE